MLLKYKAQNLPRYDRSIDTRQFVMSYKAAAAAAGGDEYTMAKSFMIIARDIAQSWYNNLPPGSIDSWGSLHEKLCNNFKGISPLATNPIELFTYTQAKKEPLRDFWRRFIQLRARTANIIDDVVILAAVNGVRPGPCSSRLARKPPKTIVELHEVMDKYIRSDIVFRSKTEALKPQMRPPLVKGPNG